MYRKFIGEPDKVAAALTHRGTIHHDHTLIEQTAKWFIKVEHSEIVQHLGEEAAVEKVQDGVGDAADVLINRHPCFYCF